MKLFYTLITVETDIYYKNTNTHDYNPYNSAHPKHCKDNLPYNLAKRIIVFVSNDEKVEMRLKELKNWLKDCHYPDSVINQSFYNAKLQGRAHFTHNLKNIPFLLNIQKYLKMKTLFFHNTNPKTCSDY